MKNIKKEDYYECDRCEADKSTDKATSLNKRYCPCPRAGYEAEIKGKIITTVEIKLK